MASKYFLGIDIGGTKIAMVLADSRGHILKSDEFLIRHKKKPRKSVQELIDRILILTSKKKMAGIGIGTPGPVNPRLGKIPWSPNLPGWEGTPICRILRKKFRLPVFIENDANLAALCENRFGSGKGKQDMIYITVSTGIGGGLILNGHLYSGHSFCGGEVGHMTIVADGNLCHCGKHGCLEAHASGTAIAREAERQLRSNSKSQLARIRKKHHIISARHVKEAAAQGDRLAIQILKQAGRYLGIGVGNLLNLLNPEMIVFGGGVMKGNKKGVAILWRSMIQSAQKESWAESFGKCRIVRTSFEDHVGALGAASLAIQKLSVRLPRAKSLRGTGSVSGNKVGRL